MSKRSLGLQSPIRFSVMSVGSHFASLYFGHSRVLRVGGNLPFALEIEKYRVVRRRERLERHEQGIWHKSSFSEITEHSGVYK
jgi:hypothetical protein